MALRTFHSPSPIINVMVQAAFKASIGLLRDFGEIENLQVLKKAPGDFVSRADHTAEKKIFLDLSKAYPDYGFILEESGSVEGTHAEGATWIVDPLDGTTNFLHGIPHFAISIALKKNDGVVAGVIYDPVKDELFWAEKGRGAFFNHKRLRVSGRAELGSAVLCCSVPTMSHSAERITQHAEMLPKILPQISGFRSSGSAALDLAYIAAGRYDGFWIHRFAPWDIAAGVLLIRESGGCVTDFSGASMELPQTGFVASNQHLHAKILQFFEHDN